MNLHILLLTLAAAACQGAPSSELVDDNSELPVLASSAMVLTKKAPMRLLKPRGIDIAADNAKPAETAIDDRETAPFDDAKPAAQFDGAESTGAASSAKNGENEPTMEEVADDTQKLVEAAVEVGGKIAQQMKSALPAGTLEAIKEEISGLAQTVLNEIAAETSTNSLLSAANGYILKLQDGANSDNSMEGIAKLLAESDVSEHRQKAIIERLTAGDKDNVLADFVFDLLKNEAAAEEERVQELAKSTILAAEHIVETGNRQVEQLETDVSAAFSRMMSSSAAMPPVSPIAPAQMMPMYAPPQIYILPMSMPVMANPQMTYGFTPPSQMAIPDQRQVAQLHDNRQQVSPPRGMPSPAPMAFPNLFPELNFGALMNGFTKLVSGISRSPDAISGSSMRQMDRLPAKTQVSNATTEVSPAVAQIARGMEVSHPAPKGSMVDQEKQAAKKVVPTPTANNSAEQ